VKLFSVMTARAIWFFDIQDMNPKGKSIFADLSEWLKDQYHFEKFPKSTDERDEHGGLAFMRGEFQVKENTFIPVDLGIYSDGLVATAQSSTNDSEAFLKDLLDSACKEFSLIFNDSMVRRKMYLSEINIKFDGSLDHMNPSLKQFAGKILSILGLDAKSQFQVTGMIFGADQISLPLSKQLFSGFVLERKGGAPFSENRFYAKAPLPTHQHLELLEELERLLS